MRPFFDTSEKRLEHDRLSGGYQSLRPRESSIVLPASDDSLIAFNSNRKAISESSLAGSTILDSLGLKDWYPPESLSCSRRFSEVSKKGRMDAEFYRERFYLARKRLKEAGVKRFVPLDDLLSFLTNG